MLIEYLPYYKKQTPEKQKRLWIIEFYVVHTTIPLVITVYCIAYILEYI